MIVEKGKDWLIKHCKDEFDENLAFPLAVSLSTLISLEEEELIKKNWRSQLEAEKMLTFVEINQEKIAQRWQDKYQQLKRITDYGGNMEYEEMILILTLRSDLESSIRFIVDKPTKLLAELDEDLREVLKINQDVLRDSRNSARRNTGDPSTYLQSHWWWRYDEDN